MSFLPNSVPRSIFFCCLRPVSAPHTGETPITDMRKVWSSLRPEVRKKFEEKGVRNVRNYCGSAKGNSGISLSKMDPFRTKPWDAIFETKDKDEVARMCEVDGVEVRWKGRAGDDLELCNTQPASRTHPETGRVAWCNHSQVFHIDSIPSEYGRVARRQGIWRPLVWLLWLVSWFVIFLKKLLVSPRDQAMHCLYGDGTEISAADMDHVRDTIWKHSVFFDWKKGDVLCLDNLAVSHGRMLYSGDRMIVTCFC